MNISNYFVIKQTLYKYLICESCISSDFLSETKIPKNSDKHIVPVV